MQPPRASPQSPSDSKAASETTESAAESSCVAVGSTTKDNSTTSFNSLLKYIAEQNYRISLLRSTSKEIDEKIQEFRSQIHADPGDTATIEHSLDGQKSRNQALATGLAYIKTLTDDVRDHLEKGLAVMSEAEKAKQRTVRNGPELVKTLREKISSIECELVAQKGLIEVFKSTHAFFSASERLKEEKLGKDKEEKLGKEKSDKEKSDKEKSKEENSDEEKSDEEKSDED